MKMYRVSVWATIDTEAGSEDDAIEIAHDLILNQKVNIKDFDFTVEDGD